MPWSTIVGCCGVLSCGVALVASGCSGSGQATVPAAPPVTSAAKRVEPVRWSTALGRDHPLVGRIWSVRASSFVDEDAVRAALHGYVLLGEKHDNPDHHALQARLLRAMVDAGQRPVVAFEMFDADDQPAITASQREHPRDAASLSGAAHWEKSGWPPWADYAPIAQIALDANLPLVATGLPRARMRALMQPSAGGGDAGAPPAIDEGVPLTPALEVSLREELRESHCGHLPEARIGAMVRFQRARDAAMAAALVTAVESERCVDAVLVAGTGHTRIDRGAGRDLSARDPKPKITSVAFAEVESGKLTPTDYAPRWNATALPFDFVWFTPRANDDDPCAGFAH